MADTKKVLMGDTTATAVGKINQGIENAETALLAVEAIEDKISAGEIGSGNVDKIIRTAPHEGLEDYEYLPDENKVIDLPFYTADEVDIALGNLAGGMRYMGTLGTNGTITALPSTPSNSSGETLVRSGDTYKIITSGTYNSVKAEVGDLVIATVKNAQVTWTFVPSGDDGDVYAGSTWKSEGEFIVTDSANTAGKKVKASGFNLVTSISDTSTNKQIPSAFAVNALIKNKLAATITENTKQITINNVSFEKVLTDGMSNVLAPLTYEYQAMVDGKYEPVAVYDKNDRKRIVDMAFDYDVNTEETVIALGVDESMWDSLIGGHVILNWVDKR